MCARVDASRHGVGVQRAALGEGFSVLGVCWGLLAPNVFNL